jgi:hypothetical protein
VCLQVHLHPQGRLSDAHLTMNPVMFCRNTRGIPLWLHSWMKWAPFSADSVNRMPLLATMPTGCPWMRAKPVTSVCVNRRSVNLTHRLWSVSSARWRRVIFNSLSNVFIQVEELLSIVRGQRSARRKDVVIRSDPFCETLRALAEGWYGFVNAVTRAYDCEIIRCLVTIQKRVRAIRKQGSDFLDSLLRSACLYKSKINLLNPSQCRVLV